MLRQIATACYEREALSCAIDLLIRVIEAQAPDECIRIAYERAVAAAELVSQKPAKH
jgi:hypothetical protein